MVTAGVVGGLGIAAVAGPAQATGGDAAGNPPKGTTAVEFRGRIDQSGSSGPVFTSYGYLTRIAGLPSAALFSGTPNNESTARLTAYASGDLVARVLDTSVHSLDIVGSMTVYQRQTGGASFLEPSSFQVGTSVAGYDLTLQDVLTVFAVGRGLPTLTGDMVQTFADRLQGPLAGTPLGHPGTRLRMFATGLGALIDPVSLVAQLEIAGNWAIE
jgi:hypothetical protein